MARAITVSICGAFFATVGTVVVAADEAPPGQSRQTHQEWMASLGYQRHSGGWRTAQEIEILERNEKTNLAQKQWNKKLERLRQEFATGDAAAAAEELVVPGSAPELIVCASSCACCAHAKMSPVGRCAASGSSVVACAPR